MRLRVMHLLRPTMGRAAAIIVAVALFSAGGGRLQAQSTIPDRLSDSTFWQMVTEFSEPTGVFPSENFTSNETGFQVVIPHLLQVTRPGGVYLGVGPEQNFTYIVALHPKLAFITDIRRQNLLQHLIYKSLFELYDNRADFLAHLFSRARPAGLDTASTAAALFAAYTAAGDPALMKQNLADVLRHLTNKHGFKLSADDSIGITHVVTVFYQYGTALNYGSRLDGLTAGGGGGFGGGRGGGGLGGGRGGRGMVNYAALMTATDATGLNRSFLATEANYRQLRDLQLRNAIIPVVGDFGGPKALRAVGAYLAEHKATITAFYCSNVESYLFPNARTGVANGGWQNFYNTVATLPIDSLSTFIRSGGSGAGAATPNLGGGRGGAGAGGMGTTLLATIQATVTEFKAGKINSYQDILSMSRP